MKTTWRFLGSFFSSLHDVFLKAQTKQAANERVKYLPLQLLQQHFLDTLIGFIFCLMMGRNRLCDFYLVDSKNQC